MTVGIYLIQDKITQENLYVGQSKNIEQRWKEHLKNLRGNRHLDSFNEYFKSIEKDESRLLFSILEGCEDDDLVKNELEIKWFNILKPKFYGTAPSLNNKWSLSEETRNKIRKGIEKSRKGKLILDKKQICDFCLKEFYFERIKKFCSKNCSYKGRSERVSKNNNKVDLDELKELYDSGFSIPKLSEHFGVSVGWIHSFMNKNNIKRRTLSETTTKYRIENNLNGRTLYNFICKFCQKSFTSLKKQKIYCSIECKNNGLKKKI